MEYRRRVIDASLDELMPGLQAIELEGPRGVGKTTTASQRARTVRNLDDPAQRAIAEADPALMLSGDPPVLIDEWQWVPGVWDAVRRAVDRGCAPGSYLLTSSARPTTPPAHSGAGRIVSLRMWPMSLFERGCGQPMVSLSELLQDDYRGQRRSEVKISGRTEVSLSDYVREIVRSGLPGVRGLESGRARRRRLDGYLRRIVDTSFREQGHPIRCPETLERWMAAYAAATATPASYETIRDAAAGAAGDKPAKTTTLPYRDVLEQLWIVDPVPPWLPIGNRLNRLGWSPKHHFADPALAARALGLDESALLTGKESRTRLPHHREGTLLEHLFESLVTLGLRAFAQASEAEVWHLRTQGGRRMVDLIVGRANERVVAFRVKLGGVVEDADVKHLLWLREKLGDDLLDAAVLNTGAYAYRRKDGIAVIPAALLGP